MLYAVEFGSDGMIYIPSFIKIGSDIQKLIKGIHRQHCDCISLLLLFFQIKGSRLIKSDLKEISYDDVIDL
jgi:hypothetical protein